MVGIPRTTATSGGEGAVEEAVWSSRKNIGFGVGKPVFIPSSFSNYQVTLDKSLSISEPQSLFLENAVFWGWGQSVIIMYLEVLCML